MRRFLLLALLASACAPGMTIPETTSSTTTTSAPVFTTTTRPASALSDQIVPLGSALYEPATTNAPIPVRVTVEGVGIESAPIIEVGVEANGEMEIPGASEVGWYRFGPTPRDEGSAVLAAHIAFNGRNGVFRRLANVVIGSIVTVEYDDGSTTAHVVREIAQYGKEDLPLDRVFSKSGPQVLTLITCGGFFNRSLNSYSDNVVVYATPMEG
jgi:LPXTG-site transpeptidase (sortase) family protein